MLIEKYLEVVVKQRGSDLHISAGLPPVVRIDGNLQRMDVPECRRMKPEDVGNMKMEKVIHFHGKPMNGQGEGSCGQV